MLLVLKMLMKPKAKKKKRFAIVYIPKLDLFELLKFLLPITTDKFQCHKFIYTYVIISFHH